LGEPFSLDVSPFPSANSNEEHTNMTTGGEVRKMLCAQLLMSRNEGDRDSG